MTESEAIKKLLLSRDPIQIEEGIHRIYMSQPLFNLLYFDCFQPLWLEIKTVSAETQRLNLVSRKITACNTPDEAFEWVRREALFQLQEAARSRDLHDLMPMELEHIVSFFFIKILAEPTMSDQSFRKAWLNRVRRRDPRGLAEDSLQQGWLIFFSKLRTGAYKPGMSTIRIFVYSIAHYQLLKLYGS